MSITTYGELKTAVANWLHDSTLTSRIPEFISLAEDRINQKIRVRAMEASLPLRLAKTVDGGTVGGTADAITLTPDTAATSYAYGDTYKFDASANNTGAATVDISGLGAQSVKNLMGGIKSDLAANELLSGVEVRIVYDGTDFVVAPPGGIPLPTRYKRVRRIHLAGDEKRLTFFPSSVFWTRNAVNESSRPKIYTIEGDFLVFAPVPDAGYTGRLLYYRGFEALSSDSDTNWVINEAKGLLLYGALLEAAPFLTDDGRALTWATMWDQAKSDVEDEDREDRYPAGPVESRSDVGVV